MKNITATETHRLSDSVHLAFTDDDGKDLYPGGRYVKAEDWDNDPEKVTAEVAQYLAQQPAKAEAVATLNATPLKMTGAQVTTKLEAIQAEKDRIEAERIAEEERIAAEKEAARLKAIADAEAAALAEKEATIEEENSDSSVSTGDGVIPVGG